MMSEKTSMINVSATPSNSMWVFASVVIGYVSRIRPRRTSLAVLWENDTSIEEAVVSGSSTLQLFGWV